MRKLPITQIVTIILCALLVASILCMDGCSVEEEESTLENKRFQMIDSDQISIDDREVYKIYVDTETGVLYVRMCSGYQGGFSVMVDQDGKPLVIEDWNKRLVW